MATLMAAILGAVVGGVMWATFGLAAYPMLNPRGANSTESGAAFAYLSCLPTGAAAGAGLAAGAVLLFSDRHRDAGVACLLPTLLVCPAPLAMLAITAGCLLGGQGSFGVGLVALMPSLLAVGLGIGLLRYRPAPVTRRLIIQQRGSRAREAAAGQYGWAVLAGIGGAVLGGLAWAWVGGLTVDYVLGAQARNVEGRLGYTVLFCFPAGAAAGAGIAAAAALARSGQWVAAGVVCLVPTLVLGLVPLPPLPTGMWLALVDPTGPPVGARFFLATYAPSLAAMAGGAYCLIRSVRH